MTHPLIDRLERVRETGAGRYLASCPAHKDRSPSLSIRLLDDGRVLLHCFAGCEVEDVVGSVGMTVSDLFPDRPLTQTAIKGSPFKLKPAEALMLLGHESFVVGLLAEELATLMRAGDTPSELALARLRAAVGRNQAVRSFAESITPPEIKAIRRGEAA